MKMTLLTPEAGPLARYRASLELTLRQSGLVVDHQAGFEVGIGCWTSDDAGKTRAAMFRHTGVVPESTPLPHVGLLCSEGYGSAIVQTWDIYASDARVMPARTHGPDGPQVRPWDFTTYPRQGVAVKADCPQLERDLLAATRGERPLPMTPRFPARLPAAPSTYQTEIGAVEGLLILDREGRPRVLRFETLRAMEWPGSVDLQWSDLDTCPPTPFVRALAGAWRTMSINPAG